jgi:hypothetical protein
MAPPLDSIVHYTRTRGTRALQLTEVNIAATQSTQFHFLMHLAMLQTPLLPVSPRLKRR